MSTKILHGHPDDYLPKAASKVGGLDLIFATVPSNIGQPYPGDKPNTHIPLSNFEREMMDWMEPGWDALKEDGVLVVYCHTDRICDTILDIARSWGWPRVGWIVLSGGIPDGPDDARGWPTSHAHLLAYAHGPDHTYNGDTGDGTVWEEALQKGEKETEFRGPQLSEETVQRVIAAYTDFGDTVLEVFGTAGTVPTVAAHMKRNAIAIEPSARLCRVIRERMEEGPTTL